MDSSLSHQTTSPPSIIPVHFTSLNGISSQGNICGRYVDASGIAHGFLARAKGIPSANRAGMLVTP